jgi:toxin ParE1/3/4
VSAAVVLAGDAARDIAAAYDWCAVRGGAELALRFLDSVGLALERIEQFPELHSECEPGVRRALVPPFPYQLLYEIDAREVIVHRCFHVRRSPPRWR